MNMKTRWFVRGMLVGIALMLALNFVLRTLGWSAKCRSQSRRRPTAEDDRDLMNMKTRWFVRGMLVGIALMLALNFVLTR